MGLTLVRDVTYSFYFHDKKHNFVLTTNSAGYTTSGILSDPTFTWKFFDGTIYEDDLLYYNREPYAGLVYSIDDSERIYLDKLVFTPDSDHPDTLYFQCTQHENEGFEVTIADAQGSIINQLELYYSLCFEVSNRLNYTNPVNSGLVDYFLRKVLPAGINAKLINNPPSGTLLGDTDSWYDPDTLTGTVELSGLTTDVENDILSYEWEQTAPLTALLTGSGLLSTVTNADALEMSAELTNPPVDTIFDFRLSIGDTYNTTRRTAQVKVSGLTSFDTWDHDDFAVGDCRLPFTLLL